MKTLMRAELLQVTGAANLEITRQFSAEGFTKPCVNALLKVFKTFQSNPDITDEELLSGLYADCNEQEIALFNDRQETTEAISVSLI